MNKGGGNQVGSQEPIGSIVNKPKGKLAKKKGKTQTQFYFLFLYLRPIIPILEKGWKHKRQNITVPSLPTHPSTSDKHLLGERQRSRKAARAESHLVIIHPDYGRGVTENRSHLSPGPPQTMFTQQLG